MSPATAALPPFVGTVALFVNPTHNEVQTVIDELRPGLLQFHGEEEPAFRPWPLGDGHQPKFCVWELRAVCHEEGAWGRYLRSARDAVAKREYLGDTYTGSA